MTQKIIFSQISNKRKHPKLMIVNRIMKKVKLKMMKYPKRNKKIKTKMISS